MKHEMILKDMINKTDILKLKDLPIEQVAEALGLQVSHHKALCPFHADKHPSLTFHRGRNRYRCFVCDARGGTIDLVMNDAHLSFYDACQWLANHESVTLCPEPVKRKVSKAPFQPIDTHYLEGLVAHPYLCPEAADFLFNQRHLDSRVVCRQGLTSISHPVPMSGNPNGSWFNAPSLLIPYRDVDGRLLSVQARYLGKLKPETGASPMKPETGGPCPRFQFPKGSRCSIYNLPVLRLLRDGEPLFVTEGCSDCWSMLSAGHKAIAIPSATALKESDLKVLEKYVVHIFPDNDKAGEGLYDRLVQASLRFGFTLVRHQLPKGCKDFSDYYLKQLKPDSG